MAIIEWVVIKSYSFYHAMTVHLYLNLAITAYNYISMK